ncbi:MAG: hypothetical protein ACRECV_18260 [Xanthobacteraceae bacterium]
MTTIEVGDDRGRPADDCLNLVRTPFMAFLARLSAGSGALSQGDGPLPKQAHDLGLLVFPANLAATASGMAGPWRECD